MLGRAHVARFIYLWLMRLLLDLKINFSIHVDFIKVCMSFILLV